MCGGWGDEGLYGKFVARLSPSFIFNYFQCPVFPSDRQYKVVQGRGGVLPRPPPAGGEGGREELGGGEAALRPAGGGGPRGGRGHGQGRPGAGPGEAGVEAGEAES